jgi:hypothetical protein
LGNLTGTYGKEYYYDYPASNPLARIIMIAPGLTFTNGGAYNYSVGSPHYNWTASAIDGARAAGIPWVIVGMHKVCLSTGSSACWDGMGTITAISAASSWPSTAAPARPWWTKRTTAVAW